MEAPERNGLPFPGLSGGCLCGAVRFELHAPPKYSYLCHCSMCRRSSGAAVQAWLTVPLTGFRVTRGLPKSYRSSDRFERHFCGDCGSPICFMRLHNAVEVEVNTGALDRPQDFPPGNHIWVASRLPWLSGMAPELPAWEGEVAGNGEDSTFD